MASHSATTLVLLFTYFFLFSFSSSLTTNNRINSICAHTKNPNFCITSLEGYLGGKKADTNELGIVSVLLATAQARMNKYVVEQLIQSVSDSSTQNVLLMCDMDYEVILEKLHDAYILSHSKDYMSMIELVYDAIASTNDCTNEWMQLLNRPPSSSSSLKDDNQKMVWLNDIALAILVMLNNKSD